MLRAFLAGRAGLICRPHAAPRGKAGIIRFSTVSCSDITDSHFRVNLHNANEWLQFIAPSLKTFLTLEKHLMIPFKFVVPYGDSKWPEMAWGYPLGLYCKNMRARKQQQKNIPSFAVAGLKALNFPWDLRQHKWDVLVLPSIRKYYELYGHCDITNAFVVPTGDDAWPKVLWGFRLGQTVTSMRNVDTYKRQRENSHDELENIGFTTQSWRIVMWETKILPALEAFQREFKHCNVNYNFVVPNSEEWPKPSRGLRLGATVANMRCRGNYEDLATRDKYKLEAIGFTWSPENDRWTFRIMPAFAMYRRVYKSGWVPVDFIVPNKKPWPKASRGLRLGNVFMKVRHTGAYAAYVDRDKKRLDALGIEFGADLASIAAWKTEN